MTPELFLERGGELRIVREDFSVYVRYCYVHLSKFSFFSFFPCPLFLIFFSKQIAIPTSIYLQNGFDTERAFQSLLIPPHTHPPTRIINTALPTPRSRSPPCGRPRRPTRRRSATSPSPKGSASRGRHAASTFCDVA